MVDRPKKVAFYYEQGHISNKSPIALLRAHKISASQARAFTDSVALPTHQQRPNLMLTPEKLTLDSSTAFRPLAVASICCFMSFTSSAVALPSATVLFTSSMSDCTCPISNFISVSSACVGGNRYEVLLRDSSTASPAVKRWLAKRRAKQPLKRTVSTHG